MYPIALFLHNTTRWLVLAALALAIVMAWHGWWRSRAWGKWDERAGQLAATIVSIQFVLGLILLAIPNGMARAAWRDLSVAMSVRDLRFFGFEHPLQMVIAVGVVHLGRARSRKSVSLLVKYRWAAITFTIAMVLILTMIPWWRPLLRSLQL